MTEMETIELDSLTSLKGKSFIAVVDDGSGGWSVVQHLASGGVAPRSRYPTARYAAARLLQLLHIGPVAPQIHPEEACIGFIGRGPPLSPTTNGKSTLPIAP